MNILLDSRSLLADKSRAFCFPFMILRETYELGFHRLKFRLNRESLEIQARKTWNFQEQMEQLNSSRQHLQAYVRKLSPAQTLLLIIQLANSRRSCQKDDHHTQCTRV